MNPYGRAPLAERTPLRDYMQAYMRAYRAKKRRGNEVPTRFWRRDGYCWRCGHTTPTELCSFCDQELRETAIA